MFCSKNFVDIYKYAMNACDPSADIKNLRDVIKQNTGLDVSLSRKEICQVYEDVQEGKLPLPPLVLTKDRTYLLDKRSPLTVRDYEILFSSKSTVANLKRVMRKLKAIEPKDGKKSNIIKAIRVKLKSLNVREPIKIASKKKLVKVDYNSAMENVLNNGNILNNNTVLNNNNRRNNNVSNNNMVLNNNNNRRNNNTPNNNRRNNNTTPNNNRRNNAQNSKVNFPSQIRMSKPNMGRNKTRTVSRSVFFPQSLFGGGGRPRFLGGSGTYQLNKSLRKNLENRNLEAKKNINAGKLNTEKKRFREQMNKNKNTIKKQKEEAEKELLAQKLKIKEEKNAFNKKIFQEMQRLEAEKKNFERRLSENKFNNTAERNQFRRLMNERSKEIEKKQSEMEEMKKKFVENMKAKNQSISELSKDLERRLNNQKKKEAELNARIKILNVRKANNVPKANKKPVNQNAIKQVKAKLGWLERGPYIKRLEAGENRNTVLADVNAILNNRKQIANEKQERLSKINKNAIKQVKAKLGWLERGPYIKRLEAGENRNTVLADVNAILNKKRQRQQEQEEKKLQRQQEQEEKKLQRRQEQEEKKLQRQQEQEEKKRQNTQLVKVNNAPTTNTRKLKNLNTMKSELRNMSKSRGISINSAYKRLSLKYHPNKGGNALNFSLLKQAYDELSKLNVKPTVNKKPLAITNKKNNKAEKIRITRNMASRLQQMTDLSRENRKRFMNRLSRGESGDKILSNAQKEVEAKKKKEQERKRIEGVKNLSSKLQRMKDLSRENRKRFINRLSRGESSNKILSNAQKEVERKKKQERDTKFKNLSSKLQSMKNLTRENRKRYMNRLSRGEDPQKILSNARKNITNKKRKENVRKMWNKKKQNLNQSAKRPAINRIQRMRGLGVKNKQMYIRRIKESKNVDKILSEASKRNVMLRL